MPPSVYQAPLICAYYFDCCPRGRGHPGLELRWIVRSQDEEAIEALLQRRMMWRLSVAVTSCSHGLEEGLVASKAMLQTMNPGPFG